jgi:AmmeMemoRadiSam system protein B
MKKPRAAAVAGRFYPADPDELRRDIDQFTAGAGQKIKARACLVPHAGYMYSGGVAGKVYRAIEIPSRILMLGPRHFPRGESLAILSDRTWQTPLGDAQIDSGLAAELKQAFPLMREDAVAHETEHALEVQLPFLQRLAGDFRFVPIVLGTERFDVLEQLGRAIAKVYGAQKQPFLILTSSDMNHYESDAITRVKDRVALDRIAALDPAGLQKVIHEKEISMCGYGSASVMMTAMRALGATQAEIVAYATSAEVSGDFDWVVGYAGAVVS